MDADHAQDTVAPDTLRADTVWQGLAAGEWVLLDHFDADGRRFLLASRSSREEDRSLLLTARERRICALVAQGQRDKEVAYELGLSLSVVSAAVSGALGKLKLRSRAELALEWRRR